MKTATLRQQRGATLVVALIFLVLMSLFAISAFNSSSTNLRLVGNMQSRQETFAAAQVAIEKTISTIEFSTNPDAVAATPVAVDIDGNGSADYSARISPKPKCYRVQPIKTSELNTALPGDLACLKSGALVAAGIDTPDSASAAGNSMCANTEWNIRAAVTDTRSGAVTAVNQGVAVRVLETDAKNSCK